MYGVAVLAAVDEPRLQPALIAERGRHSDGRCANPPFCAVIANRRPPSMARGMMVMALGQLLACLTHRNTGLVGVGTDVDDRCQQCVLLEVVGLPPDDLVEHIWLDAAQSSHGQREDR